MIALLVVAHAVAGALVLAVGRSFGRWVFAVGLAPLVVSCVVMGSKVPSVLDGAQPSGSARWVGGLRLALSFRIDGFALLMSLLVLGIGAVVMTYAYGYFSEETSTVRVVRFVGYFTMFAGAMLGLVVAGDVWTLFLFWEATTVLSFMLIGLDDHIPNARAAALRALLVTGAGGLAMLGGLVCLVHSAGTPDLQKMLAVAPTSTTAQIGLVLVLVGAFAKSAQFPLHFWLPGAMAAPTPVSAFLHSATMVKAGIVIVARFAPAFSHLGWWRPVVVCVGGVTMLVGGVAALRRDDAKQSLAFGTVSQLGLLVVLFGVGTPLATAAGVALLLAHALFKSALFLSIGAVEHATGSRDLRRLSGVGRRMPLLAAACGACTLSMIGLPPLLGFAAKESAVSALVDAHGGWMKIALVVVVAGSILTTAYSVRLWWGMFATKAHVPSGEAATVHHRASWILDGPVVALAGLSLLGGLVASTIGSRLIVASESLDDVAHGHLTLWPGLHVPLLLSGVIVAAGAGLFALLMRRDDRLTTEFRTRPQTMGERAFGRAYSGILDGARRLTLVTQSGSLPVYVAVVFSVVVVAVGFALARGAGSDVGHPVLADSALQAAVAVLAIVMSIAVVMSRRRFVAVLLLGGVGQGLTVLFLMYGAPDLALTQFMIETLMIVAFVLVLRHLPVNFSPAPSWAPLALRIGISLAVGLGVAWFALAAGNHSRPTDVTDAVNALSLPEAGGRNVVNVTVVDFRGVDTMFEITVFGVGALGVANLVGASTRNRPAGSTAVVRSGSSRFAKIGAQSMIFEQVTRMVFHVTLLVSVYVLLRGTNAPGGGFAGGLIAGAAFVFRLLAGGSGGSGGAGDGSGGRTRSRVARLSPVSLIPIGMLLAIGSGLVALVTGNEFLESKVFHFDLAVIGPVEFVSPLFFDIGVYLLVIGVVILVLGNLASRTHGGGVSEIVS